MKNSKAQIVSVSRQIVAKATSWGQVAKQLSGMTGKITLSQTESVSVKQAFALLGVNAKSNKYTPEHLFAAWAKELKETTPMHRTGNMYCPLLSKAVNVTAFVDDTEYKLYQFVNGKYDAIKQHILCRVVKQEDKEKGSNDILVSAKVVLQGLVQSVFVTETLAKIENDKKAVANIETAFINTGNVSAPVWVQVWKINGKWTKEAPKKTPKKTTKK